jgi:UDP-N-acetyl-D-galactosamine dehydrogenase
VDPYYLTYKSEKLGYSPEVILSGRRINDGIPAFLAKRLAQMLLHNDIRLKGARVLVMGITFKENVSDIRNSKVADLIRELHDYLLEVDVVDPFADPKEVQHEYGLTLSTQPTGVYDAVILAVSHQEYIELPIQHFENRIGEKGILMDIKGIRSDLSTLSGTYWRM